MRRIKRTLSLLLLLAAVAVALGTAFSDHSDDYGKVPLPQGGVVRLPEGRVVVYYRQAGGTEGQQSSPLSFQVVPAGGGDAVPVSSDNGTQVANADQPSETIGELGAVAKLDVPAAGNYLVDIGGTVTPGVSTLDFGTNAGTAVLARWRLLAGLVLASILVALIPVPRAKKRWEDEPGPPTGWSSDPRAPYAG